MSTVPAPRIHVFTDREVELAHQMAAAGLEWEPMDGMVLYDNRVESDPKGRSTPFPSRNALLMLIRHEVFVRDYPDPSGRRKSWVWLPVWSEARAWLRSHGKTDAEVLDRVRESVVDTGKTDLEALYEIMLGVLKGA